MKNFGASFKWFVVTLFMVGGVHSIFMADATGNYKWLAPVAMLLATGYLFWFFWCKDYKQKVLIVNAVSFVVCGLVAYHFIDYITFLAFGVIYDLPGFVWWVVLNAVIGIPAMMIAKG